VPRAQQDWHRKLCSRFLGWVRPGQGPGEGGEEVWTCHQRPLGRVSRSPSSTGWARRPVHRQAWSPWSWPLFPAGFAGLQQVVHYHSILTCPARPSPTLAGGHWV
jgi:hypothetical protein